MFVVLFTVSTPMTPALPPPPGKVLMLEYYHITYNFVIKLVQQ